MHILALLSPSQTHISLAFLSLVLNRTPFMMILSARGEDKKKKKLKNHVVSKLHGLTVCPANRIVCRSLNLDIEFHLLLKCICVF